jgi:hypothetical protein
MSFPEHLQQSDRIFGACICVVWLVVMLILVLASRVDAQPIVRVSPLCTDNTQPKTVAVSETHAGSDHQQVIAGVASKKIYIYQWVLESSADVGFKFTEGTGTDCVTGTADLTQAINPFSTVNRPVDSESMYKAIVTNTAADALCLFADGAATIQGFLIYCQE